MAGHESYGSAYMEAYLGRTLGLIVEHGHAVQMVGSRDTESSPYAYTVGLTAQQRPELVCCHGDPRAAAAIVNAVEPHVGAASVPALIPAEVVGLSVPVRLRGPVVVGHDADQVCLAIAERIYEDREVTAWQVLWPDRAGRWPDEPGFDHGAFRQQCYELAAGAGGGS